MREGRNTGQALVQLVTAPGDAPGRGPPRRRRCGAFPEVRSIHWAVNDSPAEVTNLPTNLLWGEEAIEEEILGLRFRVRPNAFLQTNTAMAERLYELRDRVRGAHRRRDGLRPLLRHRHDRAGDGLAGAHGVGGRDLGGVGRLRDRERRAERDHECRVLRGRGRRVARGAAPSAPGRRTSSSSTRRARGSRARRCAGSARLEAPRIVYVSCNPTTLAGNVKDLVEDWGYTLAARRPVDMFPHTPHVESVALLDQGLTGLRSCPSGRRIECASR